MSFTLDFTRMHPPRRHGEVVIEPPADELPGLIERNRRLADRYRFKLLDRPVREVRAETRAACGVADDRPVVLTGHQPEFIHPGVWAKHIVATRLAEAVGGVAANLVVENDAPGEFAVRVPHEAPDRPGRIVGVRYAGAARGTPFEFLPALPAADVVRLEAQVREGLGARWAGSMAEPFFRALRGTGGARDYVAQMLAARQAVEADLGVRLEDWRSGQVWGGPLLGEILVNARKFAEAYNAALADYRWDYGGHSTHQLFPDLAIDEASCEVPLWAYRPGGLRRRVFIRQRGRELVVLADDEAIGAFDPRSAMTWHSCRQFIGALSPWVLRPRALTLTLWARLLSADLFIHGLGGADYDRATDLLIRRYFGVTPPALACASATLLWSPEAAAAQVTLGVARRVARDFRFNPQRYMDGDDLDGLLAARLAAIAEGLRLRVEARHDRPARRQAFVAVREANTALAARRPGVAAELENRANESERLAVNGRVGADREVFFAFHPRRELEGLLAAVPGVQAFG